MNWEMWHWPNNVASLLNQPLTIALFIPHKTEVKVQISNWLEFALRTGEIFRVE